jgi:hypothetical protein
MTDLFNTLQDQYQTLIARMEKGESDEQFLKDARSFISDAKRAGATISDLNERSQLRAWMRFLASVLYDATGVYPDITLQPLTEGQLIGPKPEPSERPPAPRGLAWTLLGGAAVAIIAVSLAAVGWMSQWTSPRPAESPTPIPAPTPTPALFVIDAAVGAQLAPSGALEMPTDTFCLGTSEIVADLTIEGIKPGMEWWWEVQRDGETIDAQPAAPWGQEAQRATVHILTGGSGGVEPGHYDLLVYVGGYDVVGVKSFRVLDTLPRVFDLQVADVPDLSRQTREGSGGTPAGDEFEAGVRVFYLGYSYEGWCPGLEIAHTLYHEGEIVQESVDTWDGPQKGLAQISFQAPGNEPFPPGSYEATVTVANEEAARARFSIEKAVPDVIPPTFGDITVALGVQPDGQPILTRTENRFDWNTKVIYAIFEYAGMKDGLKWTTVWTRNGAEVAREERFWDVEADGTQGKRWVTYYDKDRQQIPGGNYSVMLYIEDVVQSTAEFTILYYVPPG